MKSRGRSQEIFLAQKNCQFLLDEHLLGYVVYVGDVRPLVGVGVDALGHEASQALAVLVRGQRRVVALQKNTKINKKKQCQRRHSKRRGKTDTWRQRNMRRLILMENIPEYQYMALFVHQLA